MELIASVLPDPSQKTADSSEEPDADTEEVLRKAVILLLRFIYAEAQTQLERTNEELELLRNAPPSPPQRARIDDPRLAKKDPGDDLWRLDGPVNKGGPDGKGPLLDPQGKVSTEATITKTTRAEPITYSRYGLLYCWARTLPIVLGYKPKFSSQTIAYRLCRLRNTWR